MHLIRWRRLNAGFSVACGRGFAASRPRARGCGPRPPRGPRPRRGCASAAASAVDLSIIADLLIGLRIDRDDPVAARISGHPHAQQQADRLQPRPAAIVEGDPLVRVAGQSVGDQGQPSPPVVLFVHVGDDVVRHLRPRVLLDLGLHVVDPCLRRADLDDQRRPHALVASDAKGLPVLPPLDPEDHRQIGAVVTQSGDVPVDPAIGEDGDRGVVGMPGLEDRPQVGAVVSVGISQYVDVSEPGV